MKLQQFLIFLCSAVLLACSNNKETATAPLLPPPPDLYWDRETKTGSSQRGEFASLSTPIGRYQFKLYRTIGERWVEKLKEPSVASTLIVDRLLVRFHVQPNGALGEIEAVKGKMDSVLGRITADSFEKASKAIDPFDSTLMKSYPNGFVWEICFRIY
jgi:hypothetical protein